MSIIKKILAGFNAFKSTLVKNAGLAYFNPNFKLHFWFVHILPNFGLKQPSIV